MKRPTFFICSLALCFLFSCAKQTTKNAVTQKTDYEQFLAQKTNNKQTLAEQELLFWQAKYDAAPNQLTFLSKIANAHSTLFECTGQVEHLVLAGKMLEKANTLNGGRSANTLRALARNYIAQHRFREALVQVEKAYALGEGLTNSQYMVFDVQLELGNRGAARAALASFENPQDFNYLIRASKWADHEGDLDLAISYMEQAKTMAEKAKNEYLMQWAYTNIADFYGHAGRIDDSYQHFLKALAIDKNDVYALRGIAWIAFSNDKNTTEAKRIIQAINRVHPTPDLCLLNAKIAQYEGDEAEKTNQLEQYFAFTKNPAYGEMYNAYSIQVLSEQEAGKEKALAIAQREIQNRPTPQAYDLLAWSYLQSGNAAEALKISEKEVLGKTSEPWAQYHLAEIYKANGMQDKTLALKQDLLEAAYELGPAMEKRIEAL